VGAVGTLQPYSLIIAEHIRGIVGMNRLLGRVRWLGLISFFIAPSLLAQSSLGIGAAGVSFLLAAPEKQQSGPERNPQQAPDAKPDPPPGAITQTSPAAAGPSNQELPKRMFGMIPDFENTNDVPANQHPLTVREKYILSLHQSFDISAHVGNAFQAALQQAANGQPDYGQGWGGYGKRFAAAEGDQITGSILIYGVLPSILHEDPRYFRQGKGPMIARIWYAVNRTFVTRTDRGTNRFNNSEIFGQLVSCGISTSYYPPQDRSASRVISNWGVNLGGNSAYNVLSEYYPDAVRALFHRHPKPAAQDGN
jgi:hypothetical protein